MYSDMVDNADGDPFSHQLISYNYVRRKLTEVVEKFQKKTVETAG